MSEIRSLPVSSLHFWCSSRNISHSFLEKNVSVSSFSPAFWGRWSLLGWGWNLLGRMEPPGGMEPPGERNGASWGRMETPVGGNRASWGEQSLERLDATLSGSPPSLLHHPSLLSSHFSLAPFLFPYALGSVVFIAPCEWGWSFCVFKNYQVWPQPNSLFSQCSSSEFLLTLHLCLTVTTYRACFVDQTCRRFWPVVFQE